MGDYIGKLEGTVETAEQITNLHGSERNFLDVGEPSIHTLVQLDVYEQSVIVNGPVQLRRGDRVRFYGLTRGFSPNPAVPEFFVPTLGYEIMDDKGKVVASYDRTRAKMFDVAV